MKITQNINAKDVPASVSQARLVYDGRKLVFIRQTKIIIIPGLNHGTKFRVRA